MVGVSNDVESTCAPLTLFLLKYKIAKLAMYKTKSKSKTQIQNRVQGNTDP
jgi:hypothetical protein